MALHASNDFAKSVLHVASELTDEMALIMLPSLLFCHHCLLYDTSQSMWKYWKYEIFSAWELLNTEWVQEKVLFLYYRTSCAGTFTQLCINC